MTVGLGGKEEPVTLTVLERRNAPGTTSVEATSYTVIDSDKTLLVDDDTAGGAVTITLPAAGAAVDRKLEIKKLGTTGSVTIDADGSETIDGALTVVLTAQYESTTIRSDGSAWFSIGGGTASGGAGSATASLAYFLGL